MENAWLSPHINLISECNVVITSFILIGEYRLRQCPVSKQVTTAMLVLSLDEGEFNWLPHHHYGLESKLVRS